MSQKWSRSTQCHHLIKSGSTCVPVALGSEEGDFLRFLPYMGLEAILVM